MELAVKKAFIDKNDKGKIYKVGEPCIPMSLTELMIWLQGAFV